MAVELIKASAPGTLMLMGEHAVLRDHCALVAATDQRLSVTLTPRSDDKIFIRSGLGELETSLDQINPKKPFQFVLQAIKTLAPKQGFELDIVSAFSCTVGLGSSAAVTVATLAALMQWQTSQLDKENLFKLARDVILTTQGLGSGADAAAAVYGGMIAYQKAPLHITPINAMLAFQCFYVGYKTPTPEVVKRVNAMVAADPTHFNAVFESMGSTSTQAITAIQQQDWPQLANLMHQQQNCLTDLGVADANLNRLIATIEATPGILAAKISGSGLGDAVWALGTPSRTIHLPAGCKAMNVQLNTEGVRIEST